MGARVHLNGEARQRILDVAEALAQTRGFNGFSYGDIAERLGLTKASIHYHFPSKTDLGCALIVRYRDSFAEALEEIGKQAIGAREALRRYVKLYDGVVRNDRMCLCGMLAAEYATLPDAMQIEVRHFFDANEKWIANVLKRGRSAGQVAFKESPLDRARALIGILEGAMLLARTYGDGRRFRSAGQRALSDLIGANHP